MLVVDDPLIAEYSKTINQIGHYKTQIAKEDITLKELESELKSRYLECGQYIDIGSQESIVIKERITVSSSYKHSLVDLKEYINGQFKAYVHLLLVKELGLSNDAQEIEHITSQLVSAILNKMCVTTNVNVGQKIPKRIIEYGGQIK